MIACIFYYHPFINPIVNPADILPVNDILKLVIASEEAVTAAWRILAPYLINIKKSSYNEAFIIIKDWLGKCNTSRRLDFKPDYIIKYNLNNAKRIGYLPISIDKLNIENKQLYHMINENENLIIHKDRNK